LLAGSSVRSVGDASTVHAPQGWADRGGTGSGHLDLAWS